jgi:hypothetical protein
MVRYELEFPIKSSVSILYQCLSTPSGLSEWFCDDVDIEKNGKIFIFKWADSEQRAELLEDFEEDHVKFKWLGEEYDANDGTYFELRIQIDEITGDVALVVSDFCEPDELEEYKLLWESQIRDLTQALGA